MLQPERTPVRPCHIKALNADLFPRRIHAPVTVLPIDGPRQRTNRFSRRHGSAP